MRKPRIRPRVIRQRLVLVGVLVGAAISGATVLIIGTERQASIEAFRTATINLGNGMAQQTTQALAAVDRALSDVQTSLAAVPEATGDDVDAAMRLYAKFDLLVEQRKHLSGVEALFLADAAGRIANTSRGWPSAGQDVSDSGFFRHFTTATDQATNDHESFVGTPLKDPASGRWTTTMARRIEDAHGHFAGVVVAEVSLTDLQEFYRLAMPARRSVYLARVDGVVLVRYPQRDVEIGRKIPPQSAWYATVAKGGGTYDGAAYFDATQIVASLRPLRNLPFVVEASVTEDDVLEQWYRQRVWIAAGGLCSFLFAVVLLRLFARQYGRLEASELVLAKQNFELDTAHRQLDATLANLSQGVSFYNADQQLVVRNRRYCELYSLLPETVQPGISLAGIAELRVAAGSFGRQTIDAYLAYIDTIVRTGKPHEAIVELQNGRVISNHLQPLPGGGWVVTHEDITKRREAEAEIAFLARHDVLTGLANRSLFHQRLDEALVRAERGEAFALLYLDLDRFKAVNDTRGHIVGDTLLSAVASRLRGVVRDRDTVARLGGDEFAILQLNLSDPLEATVLARRIVQTIKEPFALDSQLLRVGVSVGIAMAPQDGLDPVQLIKAADLALYRAKHEGRNTWRFFEPAMDALVRAQRALEVDLRSALALGQLEVHYQPLVSSAARTLTGFEALLRWHHPTRGMVSPAEFIPLAEEIGLITEIGAWVLQQACAQAATWPDHVRVAVNLSSRQFQGQNLVDTVAACLGMSGIAAERLELEITETVQLQDDASTSATLHDLHALGSRIALDDFGTGYSSLSYLRSFPFDTIKIDQSFVRDLQSRDTGGAIVRGIIALATNLRMHITAEGVETEEQYAFLTEAGCTDIQGYLISRPLPARELPALIERLSSREASPQQAVVG
jgi:diguanylate cyclase (GGDEF)-like protein